MADDYDDPHVIELSSRRIPPFHPGELLHTWVHQKPAERVSQVLHSTQLSARELDDIIECKAPIDERVARELSKVVGPAAELWFRMQFVFDFFQEHGYEPRKSEWPTLSPDGVVNPATSEPSWPLRTGSVVTLEPKCTT